jgi:hypothetical protein
VICRLGGGMSTTLAVDASQADFRAAGAPEVMACWARNQPQGLTRISLTH